MLKTSKYDACSRVHDAARGTVVCRHVRAAIVGAGPGRAAAPWGDGSWCWWALNEIDQPRFGRHFELHPMAVQSDLELRWLERCPAPCYVLDLADAARASVRDDRPGAPELGRPRAFAGVANAVLYPRESVVRRTGGRDYFTNTFAMQLALAVADGFEEVGLWGVSLYEGTARERTAELACLEYWIGVADGRGVKLTVGPRWLGRRPYVYGYDYHDELRWTRNELARLRKVIEAEERSRDPIPAPGSGDPGRGAGAADGA